MTDISLLVTVYPPYRQLLDESLPAIEKYWPNHPVLVIGKDQSLSLPTRMLADLRGLDSEFVVVMHEDFCLSGPVKQDLFGKCLETMKANPKLISCSLTEEPADVSPGFPHRTVYGPDYQYIPIVWEHAIDLKPRIWHRSLLTRILSKVSSSVTVTTFGPVATGIVRRQLHGYKVITPNFPDHPNEHAWIVPYHELPHQQEIASRSYTISPQPIPSVRMTGKICITTTFDRNYIKAGLTLFKSIKRHTDCTGIDFKVITADPEVVKELGPENCHIVTDEIRAKYANVAYSKELPAEKYSTSWYRYEMFNFEKYDRVICIDSDCICIEDISYLFSEELNQYDLVSVEDHIVSKCFTKYVPQLEAQGLNFRSLKQRMKDGKIDIQPALLVANKRIVNAGWYNRLLHYANTTGFTYSVDEGILNDFIYLDNLRIKILPLEFDYQDLYEIHCPTLPVPTKPIIVHCQESKPFKKERDKIDQRMHKWHDKWWEEYNHVSTKTIVVIIVWNRYENFERWINCWKSCDTGEAKLVIVHNFEQDNSKYQQLCQENGITYVPRPNTGFDIGAFQDVCKERLEGFPNDWDNLIWITDDCIPMQKDFVQQYLRKLKDGYIPCYEISDIVKRHVRTTGFLVTKKISRKLEFPADPIQNREDCYTFEHKGFNLYEQFKKMGLNPRMVVTKLRDSCLWDMGCRGSLKLMQQHEQVFPKTQSIIPVPKQQMSVGILDDLAIKYKADKSSLYHNFAQKYDRFLESKRESFTNILEIGVAQGQSLRMWVDYFPRAIIHGADISSASQSCESYSKRIKFHLMDQGNPEHLKNLEPFSPFDLIIDDGNHFWREQIVSFQYLFPFLKKCGIYIIEDTCTSYWQNYNNNPVSCVDYFKNLVDEVNFNGARSRIPDNPSPDFNDWHNGWHRREDCQETLPDFESIHFMNSIIIIYKRQ